MSTPTFLKSIQAHNHSGSKMIQLRKRMLVIWVICHLKRFQSRVIATCRRWILQRSPVAWNSFWMQPMSLLPMVPLVVVAPYWVCCRAFHLNRPWQVKPCGMSCLPESIAFFKYHMLPSSEALAKKNKAFAAHWFMYSLYTTSHCEMSKSEKITTMTRFFWALETRVQTVAMNRQKDCICVVLIWLRFIECVELCSLSFLFCFMRNI